MFVVGPRWSVHGFGRHRRCALGSGAVVDSRQEVCGEYVGLDGAVDSVRRHCAGGGPRYRCGSRNCFGLRRPCGSGLVTNHIVGLNADGKYRTHVDGDGEADSTPTANQVVAVGQLLVPLTAIPINWYSAGAWVELADWLTVLSLAVLVTRYALLQRYDPGVWPEVWANA